MPRMRFPGFQSPVFHPRAQGFYMAAESPAQPHHCTRLDKTDTMSQFPLQRKWPQYKQSTNTVKTRHYLQERVGQASVKPNSSQKSQITAKKIPLKATSETHNSNTINFQRKSWCCVCGTEHSPWSATQDLWSENLTPAWHQTALCTFLSGHCHPIKTWMLAHMEPFWLEWMCLSLGPTKHICLINQ